METEAGRDFYLQLMNTDDEFGFKASYPVVPEKRYDVTPAFLEQIRQRGCEANVHDLCHDGDLFRTREEFLRRAEKINGYLKKFNAQGFRSGALYRNLSWFDALKCSYDMSVPNVGHLDAQTGGRCTVMPYFVGKVLEIPMTTTQDYSLFHILSSYSTTLWEEQCRSILPGSRTDKPNCSPGLHHKQKIEQYVPPLIDGPDATREKMFVWTALPREINRWWRIFLRTIAHAQGTDRNECARFAF